MSKKLSEAEDKLEFLIKTYEEMLVLNMMLSDVSNLNYGDYVITGRINTNATKLEGALYCGRKIGYLTQIRVNDGAFGSSRFLLREPDRHLSSHENQCVYVLKGEILEFVKTLFDSGTTPSLEILANPELKYTICGSEERTGFIVKKASKCKA
jgi:hypothetical protein